MSFLILKSIKDCHRLSTANQSYEIRCRHVFVTFLSYLSDLLLYIISLQWLELAHGQSATLNVIDFFRLQMNLRDSYMRHSPAIDSLHREASNQPHRSVFHYVLRRLKRVTISGC